MQSSNKNRFLSVCKRNAILCLCLTAFFCGSPLLAAESEVVVLPPQISLSGQPGEVTVHELSGFISRPLRVLVNRNNKVHGASFAQVYALGVRPGDELVAEMKPESVGVRATVYRIFRSVTDKHRYLNMPFSVYFSEIKAAEYHERIEPFEEEYLVMVYEKTDSPDEKNLAVRYFEEDVRKLVIESYKTNLFFSKLKLKMKDFAHEDTSKFFERDAQTLVNKLQNPQRIILIRLWRR